MALPGGKFLEIAGMDCIASFSSCNQDGHSIEFNGAAIAEWLGGQAGLGYFSKRMITQLDGAAVLLQSYCFLLWQ